MIAINLRFKQMSVYANEKMLGTELGSLEL